MEDAVSFILIALILIFCFTNKILRIIIKDKMYSFTYQVDGSRNEIRFKQTKLILGVLLELLQA